MIEYLFDVLLITDQTLVSFILSMLLAILLGLSIALVYRYTHKGLNYESSFLSTLVILGPIVTLVMFLIQGDLVLSLGLVGSLSIIRFRTPIKDTRDMVFLFWSIAVGLGVGTLNWTLSIFATMILGLLISAFYLVKYGRQTHNEYILIVSGHDTFNDDVIYSLRQTNLVSIQLRSTESKGNSFENIYELRFEETHLSSVKTMVDTLKKETNIEKVSLLSPQLTLPM
ncbi:MAG: DUF4956 domain-containing protein [Candidatus Izemoplasmataceae bacterium]